MKAGDYLNNQETQGRTGRPTLQASPFKESLMRDHDEMPYLVVERDSGGGLGSFILGALVGAGLALLFAPQSGEETQEEIKARAVKLRDVAKEHVRDAQENLEGRLTTAREHVQARVESVKEAVDSGRRAGWDRGRQRGWYRFGSRGSRRC
jgi:gas vesicle protein